MALAAIFIAGSARAAMQRALYAASCASHAVDCTQHTPLRYLIRPLQLRSRGGSTLCHAGSVPTRSQTAAMRRCSAPRVARSVQHGRRLRRAWDAPWTRCAQAPSTSRIAAELCRTARSHGAHTNGFRLRSHGGAAGRQLMLLNHNATCRSTVQRSAVQCSAVQCNAVQCSAAVQRIAVHCSALQRSAAQQRRGLHCGRVRQARSGGSSRTSSGCARASSYPRDTSVTASPTRSKTRKRHAARHSATAPCHSAVTSLRCDIDRAARVRRARA